MREGGANNMHRKTLFDVYKSAGRQEGGVAQENNEGDMLTVGIFGGGGRWGRR